MDRFTRVADYDVRRVVGLGPKSVPVSLETASPASALERPKKSAAKSSGDQTSIEFAPVPGEQGDHEEDK